MCSKIQLLNHSWVGHFSALPTDFRFPRVSFSGARGMRQRSRAIVRVHRPLPHSALGARRLRWGFRCPTNSHQARPARGRAGQGCHPHIARRSHRTTVRYTSSRRTWVSRTPLDEILRSVRLIRLIPNDSANGGTIPKCRTIVFLATSTQHGAGERRRLRIRRRHVPCLGRPHQ